MGIARLLANGATQVNVRTRGQAASRSLTTVANTTPILNLRDGQLLNFGTFTASDWTGPVTLITPNPLPASCTPVLKGYPGVYHACGNSNGFHWLDNVSKFVNSQASNEAMQLWVR